jgi:hypothetical protein
MPLKNGQRISARPNKFIRLTLCTDEFPASEAFDAINSVLASSEAERKEAIKQGGAVFAFTLKNKAGKTESWHIDLKTAGEVGTGLGEKPTGKMPFAQEEVVVLANSSARMSS